MQIKTDEFKNLCSTILLAVDNNAANLEIVTKNSNLFLNVTNAEYYVSCKLAIESTEEVRAVVDANLFLNLIAGITTDTFDFAVKPTTINIKAGKSNYKLPLIFENDDLMTLPFISLSNKTVEMQISKDILTSIATANGKELAKLKAMQEVTELQKLYYITNEGCFTFTSGACVNKFTLDQPIQMLLNERIVKLFKLFKDDVQFSFGYDAVGSRIQTKVIFETENIYLAALITNDDILLSKVKGPCEATKMLMADNYSNKLVLSTKALSAAISRLMLFTKNSIDKANMFLVPATVAIANGDFTFTDSLENTEAVQIENGSYSGEDYAMKVNLADIKFILDSCKEDHITLNCGNHRAVVINHGTVSNMIPEI